MKHYSNYSLKDHNTLKIDVSCDDCYVVETQDDIPELAHLDVVKKGDFMLIGDGANVLFTQDFHGTIIQVQMDETNIVSESDVDVVLHVGAGKSWHDLVEYCVEHNWGGIENMVMIPGRVGASPVGNIAAYGQNFSDVCESVRVLICETGEVVEMDAKSCEFTYRDSIFKNTLKGKVIVLSVQLRLHKNPTVNSEYWSKKHGSVAEVLSKGGSGPYSIKDVSDAICSIRRSKFPDMSVLGTAGSFFTNPVVTTVELARIQQLVPSVQFYPVNDLRYINNSGVIPDSIVKVAAGEILDSGMGYKGLWIGNVGLFEKHALVLVTNGNASGDEVDAFATKIQDDFYAFCGVKLEREVITI